MVTRISDENHWHLSQQSNIVSFVNCEQKITSKPCFWSFAQMLLMQMAKLYVSNQNEMNKQSLFRTLQHGDIVH